MEGPGDARNLQDILQTAQRIQAEVARIKEDLSSKTAEGESGGGLVRCVVSGAGEVLSVSIDRDLHKFDGADSGENLKMLEDLVVGAVNVALARAREMAKAELGRVTGGLPMPPGFFGS